MLCIAGRGAAALFAGEAGGHRWQRVPETEKRGRVHTSTITVAVLNLQPILLLLHLKQADEFLDDVAPRPEVLWSRLPCHLARSSAWVSVGPRKHPEARASIRDSRRARLAWEIDSHHHAWISRTAQAKNGRDGFRGHSPGGAFAKRSRSLVRADKRRTIRTQDDQVTDHIDGRTWRYKSYARGDW